MAKEKITLMVPYSIYNGLKRYETYEGYGYQTEPNSEFEMTFIFRGFSRGRSSVTAVFENPEKTIEASMFVSDLSDAITSGANLMNMHGIFTFVKKGANFGIKLKELL